MLCLHVKVTCEDVILHRYKQTSDHTERKSDIFLPKPQEHKAEVYEKYTLNIEVLWSHAIFVACK